MDLLVDVPVSVADYNIFVARSSVTRICVKTSHGFCRDAAIP
jgi:hypothetical protein